MAAPVGDDSAMSEFFRILQQADRDRALSRGADAGSRRAAAAPAADSVAAPSPEREPALSGGHRTGAEAIDAHLVSLLYPNSFLAEPYRIIRHRVEHLRRTAQVGIIAISSAGIGEGKTMTAINLAGALAQAPGTRVLLVDADLRRPSIAARLALEPNQPGLVEAVLDPRLALDAVARSLPAFNLDVLPAGQLPSAPYEIFESPRFGELLAEARIHYDHVILDTAPLTPIPDSRLIVTLVDGLLLVVGAHKAPRRLLGEAFNVLDPAKVLGLVFNEDDEKHSAYDYDSYGAYGAARSADDSSTGRRRWFGLRSHPTRWPSLRIAWGQRRFFTRRNGRGA